MTLRRLLLSVLRLPLLSSAAMMRDEDAFVPLAPLHARLTNGAPPRHAPHDLPTVPSP
jgi:hypothetical protein